MILTEAGEVFVMGSPENGRLGIDSEAFQNSPRKL
jgi:hypothetical protein